MSNHELMPFSDWCKQVAKAALQAVCDLVGALATLAACAISPLIYVLVAFYFLCIEGRSNCLVWAVVQRLKYASSRRRWSAAQIICERNVRGRLHWMVWIPETGNIYEWYAKGASQRSRLANLWYRGEMKKVGHR